MVVFIRLKIVKIILIVIVFLIMCLLGVSLWNEFAHNPTAFIDENTNKVLTSEIEQIFHLRNKALIEENSTILDSLYDKTVRNGLWAYEHELKKIKYLHNWSDRQSVDFIKIDSEVIIRSIKNKGEGYILNILASTEYEYVYIDAPNKNNSFRIGTYHSLDIILKEGQWIITKEWYTDPFADSLHLDEIKSKEVKEIILSGEPKDLSSLNVRRIKTVEYADQYCGAASLPEYGFQYNPKYRNYNSQGGDCTNFASQVMYEGGSFKKNSTWNYNKGAGSKAWVNAQSFKDYMLYSGRASLIASGTYDKVLKSSYKLMPGDFIAYEKKGKVAHISIVTGLDSKGYPLVNSHNSDRYRVPWDLGWNDKGIKFWLIHVNH